MKHRSLQRLFSRSRFLAVQAPFYQVCLAIVLTGVFLSIGMVVSPGVKAQAVPIEVAVSSNQNLFAGQVANATTQVPPHVVNRLRQALSQQTNIPAEKLKMVAARPKTWANGCLGLAKADEVCTQALVEGWRVVFSNGSQRWVYRTDQQACVYRLEP